MDIVLKEILNRNNISGQQRQYWELSKASDEVIWLEFQNGSDIAFEVIYRKHEEHLFYYGMKVIHNEDLVWDTIQDLFIELWHTKSRLRKVQSIKIYLFKALRWKLIRNASKQRKILHVVDDDSKSACLEGLASRENKFEEKEQQKEVKRKLKLALSKLNRKQQEIIYLRFYDGLSIKEIAKITGNKKRTVYYNLTQAMEILKGLKKHFFLFLSLLPFYRKLQKLV